MNWLPSADLSALKCRAEKLASTRSFFADRNVLEVDTPSLSVNTVTDVYLSSLTAKFQHNDTVHDLYLQTSPEFYMKRLLAAGSGCIYQICHSFRNDEVGRIHSPEFTMLEWYRVGFDHQQLMDEVSCFLQSVFNFLPAAIVAYKDIFIDYLNIDPLSVSVNELREALNCNEFSDGIVNNLDKDSILQLLFAKHIEPKIGFDSPLIVYGFPSSQAALARVNEFDSRISDRFEVFYQGVELANGYNELIDYAEQLQRFREDQISRKEKKLDDIEIDPKFMAAVSSGIPVCSGVALGFDRALMLSLQLDSISKVRSFSLF